MSLYSIEFIRNFDALMSTPGHAAHASWVEGGYLFLAPPAQVESLERNVLFQQSQGCEVSLLDTAELKRLFPSMNTADLGAGALSPRDGWCDPNGLLWGFRRKAVELGATFVQGRVESANTDKTRVLSVVLNDSRVLAADSFVNASGAWAGKVAAMFGMYLPVQPMPRLEHYFTAGQPMEKIPYIKELSRLAFRSEGEGFSGGLVDSDARRAFDFDIDHGYFEKVVWPAVAHRFEALQAAKCHGTWSGLYEQNELDGNPVIGAWVGGLPNLFTVAGFSGHGMMHAPAAGRAIAELLVHGAYQTLDLTRFGYQRVLDSSPYRELGIL